MTFRSLRGQTNEQGQRFHRLAFHVRKDANEAVRVQFSLGTRNVTYLTVQGPNGLVLHDGQLELQDGSRAAYELKLHTGEPAGDYSVIFHCPAPLQSDLTTRWPLEGEYRKLVVEMPFDIRNAGRFYFMPRSQPNGQTAHLRLHTSIRPLYFKTHRLYQPDGQIALGITEQGHVNGPLSKPFTVTPDHQEQVWLYSGSSFGAGDGAWIEGDVWPVASFWPDEFFVPEQFRQAD